MQPPPHRPLRRLAAICEGATDPDAMAREIADLLADECEADAHVFLRLDPSTALWCGVADRGHATDSCANYRDRAFLRSPYADFGWLSRHPEPIHVLTRGEAARDPYTSLYLEGYGFEQEVHTAFAHQGAGFGQLVLSRRKGAFAEHHLRLLDASRASVTAHLRRLRAREMLGAVPGESVALVGVSTTGAPCAMNAAGVELLRELDDLAAPQERRAVEGCDPSTFTTLGVMIELTRRHLLDPSVQVPRALYVSPASRRRYRLAAERLLGGDAAPRAILLAEPVRSLDSADVLRVAGLTEREAEVAVITVRGFKSAEGADALAISEHTFLTHLKNVYRKLGVGSRGELAALLLSGV